MFIDKALNRNIKNSTQGTILTVDDPSGWRVGESFDGSQMQALKISAVNACVECITNSMSKLPVYIMNEHTKERVDHPLLKLLQQSPNEAMSPAVYKKLTETNRLLSGNAYTYIHRDRHGRPTELLPLDPRYCYPYFDDGGNLWYIYQTPKTGELRKLDNYDVLHYKGFSEDGITGISVLSRASQVISTAKLAQKYEGKLYGNSARPSGILKTSTPGLSKEGREKVRAEWESIYGGADNAFRVAVLDNAFEYQTISMSNADVQFVESKAVTVEDISRFFGVPLYKINAGKQSYNSNEQNGIEYVVNTLHPIVTQYEEQDTFKLLFDSDLKKGLRIRRNMMAELRGDMAGRASWYKVMREVSAFSPNDILALEDMPSVEGGNTRYASLNYIPLHLFEELSVNRNSQK